MIIPDAIDRLAAVFRQLPGIGRRQALRLAVHLVDNRDQLLKPFEKAVESARRDLHRCAVCTVWTEGHQCPVCADKDRDHGTICVVEDLPDLEAFETARVYTGRYHVLHGRLSPAQGRGPGELSWEPLLERAATGKPAEIILATSLSAEGETTAAELARALKAVHPNEPHGSAHATGHGHLRITRIARPAGAGAEPEYWEAEELGEALIGRRTYDPGDPVRKKKPAAPRPRNR